MMNATYLDMKMSLLRGSAMKVGNLEVKPYTLGEIESIGYSAYMKSLEPLFLTVEDFLKSIEDIEQRMELEAVKNELKVFDFLVKEEIGVREHLMTVLSTVLRTDDIYILDDIVAIDFFKNGILYTDDDGEIEIDDGLFKELKNELKVVDRDSYEEIAKIVKYQNYFEKIDGDIKESDNPADEQTKLLMEQMKKNEERVKKLNKNKEAGDPKKNPVDFTDLISAVTAKSPTINKLNVWEYTLFQFYDEYSRLEIIDGYDFSIRAMIAGAKDFEIKHWSSRA